MDMEGQQSPQASPAGNWEEITKIYGFFYLSLFKPIPDKIKHLTFST